MVAEIGQTDKQKRRSVAPLARLLPYLLRYRGLVAGALVFLTLAAAATLALPLAVRRMVDHGFNQTDHAFINGYFIMLIAMALVLAVASAMRYYYVITLGERIVADLRNGPELDPARLGPFMLGLETAS